MDKNELDEDTFRINKNLVSPFLNTIQNNHKRKILSLDRENMCYKFYWIEEIPPKKKERKKK